jgi:O-antigen/teichoic acid export membrane protein
MTSAAPPSRSFARGTVSRDAAWALAYSSALRLATLGVSVAVARAAGSAGTGAFGIALQITALASMLAAFNLPQSLAKHLAERDDPARQRALLRTSGLLVLGLGLVVGGALTALAGWLGARVYRDPSLAPVIFWCGPLVLATVGFAWVEGALQGMRRFETLTRWGAAVSFLDLVVGIAAAFWGVATVLVTRIVVRALAVAFALGRWFRIGPARLDPNAAAAPPAAPFAVTAAPLLGFAGPALLAGAIVLIAHAVLRLLLVRGSGLAEAGQYQAADSVAQGLTLIPASAGAAFMRAVSSEREVGYPTLPGALRRGLERVQGYNLGLCLVTIGVVPWATVVLFGRDFAAARPALVMLAAAYGLLGACSSFGAALLGRGEVWTGVAVNLLWAMVVLGLYGSGAVPRNAAGAALAVAIGSLVLLLVSVVILAPRWTVPARSLAPVLLVTVASLAIGCALALSRIPAPVVALACFALGVAIFLRWGLPTLPWGSRTTRA